VSRRAQRLAALALLGGGVALIVLLITSTGSVRGFLSDRYERTGQRGAETLYRSPKPADATAAEIAKAHEPADRRATPEGIFLRYRDDFVRVTPAGNGSQVGIADEDRGYALYYPFIGGFWGTYSGRGETFRGGGPGGAK